MAGVKTTETATINTVTLIDKEFNVASVYTLEFGGSNEGKYVHKVKIAFLPNSDLPVVGLIVHHFEDARLVLLGVDSDLRLIHLSTFSGVHSSNHT